MNTRELYRQAVDVFLRVYDLQGEARTTALDHDCAGDPRLRMEVESLLRYHVRCQGDPSDKIERPT